MKSKKTILSTICLLLLSSLNAAIPYSIEPLLNHTQEINGFHPTDFWDAMKWQREETEVEFVNDQDVRAVEKSYLRFCQNFAKLPVQDYKNPPKQFSIPPIIHLIWLGSSIPLQVTKSFESWTKHHPGWDLKIWTDKDISTFSWTSEHSHQAFEEASTWAEKADILRLEVLYSFGGIYSDADVICLNSFQDLIVQDIGFFSCFELNYIGKHYGEPFFIGSAVMGSARKGHVVKYCLDNLQTDKEAPNKGIIKRTGPGLISRGCQHALANKSENVLILPCSFLYPLPWKKRETNSENVLNFISKETLAIHLWDGSWCPPRKKK